MADVTGHVDGRQSQTGTLDVELLSHAQSPPPKHSSQPSRLQRWREQLKPNVPDPWLQRKLGVIIVFCLAIWIFYVVVGRVCAPMIERKSDTGFSRGAGSKHASNISPSSCVMFMTVGTLCAYLVLWLLFLWNYVKIITSTPGFARDHVSKTRPPSSAPETTCPQNEAVAPVHFAHTAVSQVSEPRLETSAAVESEVPTPSELVPAANVLRANLPHAASSTAGFGTASAPMSFAHDTAMAEKASRTKNLRRPEDVARPVPPVVVGPRWCRFCEIYKPDRTHHCRHCGTCVLQFDRTCVGWANHKFFITFNLWAGLFCIYSFILLVVDAAHASRVDGEVVALIVLTGYFTLFTLLTMLPEHVYLVLSSKTTLESFRGRDQAEAETALLSHEYGWQHLRERKAVRRRWTEEWGGTKVDQRWKWGSSAQMWRQEMGDWWLGWLLPLGRPKGDGLNYRQNARFGPNGEWLRKSDWSQGSPTPARFEQPGA